jgi:hypothetical protein
LVVNNESRHASFPRLPLGVVDHCWLRTHKRIGGVAWDGASVHR